MTKKYNFILSWILVFLALIFIFIINERFIFAFQFTDEGDNISIGKYLLQGRKLYKDVFSQHQPLTYYFSSLTQIITQPENIIMVVKRHREMVMFFSFAWIILIISRFGFFYIFPVFVFEIAKYYLLGHLFLAESLVGYPLVYAFLLTWKVISAEKISRLDNLIISLCCFWVVFNLLPLAPVVIILWLTNIIFQIKKHKEKILFLTAPFFLATIILFVFVPIKAYFITTIWANYFYYIPRSTEFAFNVNEVLWWRLFKIPLYPALGFLNLKFFFFRLMALLFLAFVVNIVFQLKKRKTKLKLVFLTTCLVLANLRSPVGSVIYYHAFHSLPYLCLFVFSTYLLFFDSFSQKKGAASLKRWIFFFPVLTFVLLFLDKRSLIWEEHDKDNAQYVHFSRIFDASIAFKILGSKNDSLAVIPYEELLYWLPDIQPSTRFLFYSSWAWRVPKFKEEIEKGLKENPPTFVYWPRDDFCYLEDPLRPFLTIDDYINLPRESTFSGIYIHKNKFKRITEKQWQELEYYRYNRIKSADTANKCNN